MPTADLVRGLREGVWARERLRRAHPGVRIGSGVHFIGDYHRVQLARGVSVYGPTSLVVTDGLGLGGALLSIGPGTYIGEFGNIRCGGTPVMLGANCLVAQAVHIIGSNHEMRTDRLIAEQPWSGDGVVVGDDVWVGAGAVLLPGTRIGDGAVVGAGSVVTGAVEAGTIVVGSPARFLRRR